ncbi:hypothetical protein [uncultured Desulfuromonas sp.]|uniref:hypothetical protein n=1 Tax=uncultured Desulfuromonas sp. TaxID=181013 RepID=UPI002AAAFD6B|nr:hypothetical protein [uncultured Desulfuromonas sp.]
MAKEFVKGKFIVLFIFLIYSLSTIGISEFVAKLYEASGKEVPKAIGYIVLFCGFAFAVSSYQKIRKNRLDLNS